MHKYPLIFGVVFPIRCLRPMYRNGNLCPCGKCWLCLRKQAGYWSFRVQAEAKASKYVYNVLLTYDEQHLPIVVRDGVRYPTLRKSHLSEFLKRFRERLDRKFGAKIRFFCCGEYGGEFHRPHYHMIIFSDKDFRTLKDKRRTFDDIHDEINESWKYGFVNITPFQGETGKFARYMTQYMLIEDVQKHTISRKPFRHMSRMPAIGHQWIKDNPHTVRKMQRTGKFVVNLGKYKDKYGRERDLTMQLPPYYKDKLRSEEQKERDKQLYKEQVENFYNNLNNNYYGDKYAYSKRKQRAIELAEQAQREQYRKRKIHNTDSNASGFFEKSAQRRQRCIYEKPR